MGRVSKYKNIKACDPFSKKKTPGDTTRDEAPDIFDRRTSNNWEKKRSRYEDETYKEKQIQNEALRMLRGAELVKNNRKDTKKVDPKKESETMKEFKDRVRRETRTTLNEELPKLTVSAKRRKLKLIERSNKKKQKIYRKNHPNELEEDDEVLEFNMAENGHLRPSDLGASSSFKKGEAVQFGTVSDRPPDLSSFSKVFTNTITKMNSKKEREKDKEMLQQTDVVEEESDEDEDEDPKKKTKVTKVKITDREDLFGGDGLEQQLSYRGDMLGTAKNRDQQEYGVLLTGKKRKQGEKEKSVHHQEEMEILREAVQARYKIMQEKRRQEKEQRA